MDNTRRDLMTRRDSALKTGDIATYQALTRQIAELPLKGVKPLTQRDMDRYATGLDQRLAATVSAKLGCHATLIRWIPNKTGDVPVFAIPIDFHDRARALGLTVDAA